MSRLTEHSIFNDVLGPIMAGPSSSHSAGCARIGLTVCHLFGREIRRADVVYDAEGSYPSTCVGQGSNFGFTGGLLGMKTDEPNLKDSLQIAKERGVDIRFLEESLSHRHPNEARIDVYDENGAIELRALTFSTGGGTFEIVELDGFPVFIDGSCKMSFVKCKASYVEEVSRELSQRHLSSEWVRSEEKDGAVLFTLKNLAQIEEEALTKLLQTMPEKVLAVRHTGTILPISMSGNVPAFSTAKEAGNYVQQLDGEMSAAELALIYETSIGRVTTEDVMEIATHTLEVMKHAATNPPDPATTKRYGFLPYRAKEMWENYEKMAAAGTLANTGCLEKGTLYALSVMENNCAHHTVVAAPTAGSSGVIPAALLSVADANQFEDAVMLKGLLAAGLVGAFIANEATFGAEVAGCQAENGSASAMAAAAVVEMLGGTVEQGFRAASLALQNMLGLVCDPVGGLTEIPCISRNVAAVSNAITSANMVLLGFDPMIPLDETIQSMYEVGQMLPEELRCTCNGGLCTTPTGMCLGRK